MTETTASSTPLISVRDVGVYYSLKRGRFRSKRFWALQDVSFDLHAGDALGIIGKNGVGKSTLLKLMSGIMSPDRGEIRNRSNGTALLSIQIGFIPYLTGRENAILSGMMQGMRKREIVAALDQVLEFSELGEFFDQQIATYSAGMRARLGFSVALQLDPDVMLIDEVTSVGDAGFQAKSFEALRSRVKANKSIILVSHAPFVVQKICDRVVWIDHGKIVMEGACDEVLGAYRESMPNPPQ